MITQNGWTQINSNETRTYLVPGTTTHLILHPEAAPLLVAYATKYNLLVEALHEGWSWAWSPTNPVSDSNHLSGTAIDLNAPLHNFGDTPTRTFSPKQIVTINELCAEFGLYWGGRWDYPDGMHHQMQDSITEAAARIARLGLNPDGTYHTSPIPGDDMPLNTADLDAIAKLIDARADGIAIKAAEQVWRRFKVYDANGTTVPLQTALSIVLSSVPADANRDAAIAAEVASIPAETVADLGAALAPPAVAESPVEEAAETPAVESAEPVVTA